MQSTYSRLNIYVILFTMLLLTITICGGFSVGTVETASTNVAVEDVVSTALDPVPVEVALEAVSSAEGDSYTVVFTAEPVGSCTLCTWTLTPDESKMTNWLNNRVKDKLEDGEEYISLSIEDNICTVTALQYFRYGIKYTTYWTLTATSIENAELIATCSIQLG